MGKAWSWITAARVSCRCWSACWLSVWQAFFVQRKQTQNHLLCCDLLFRNGTLKICHLSSFSVAAYKAGRSESIFISGQADVWRNHVFEVNSGIEMFWNLSYVLVLLVFTYRIIVWMKKYLEMKENYENSQLILCYFQAWPDYCYVWWSAAWCSRWRTMIFIRCLTAGLRWILWFHVLPCCVLWWLFLPQKCCTN